MARLSAFRSVYVPALLGLAGLTVVATSLALEPAERGRIAVWAPREIRFVYMGFTTHYSCEGLRDNVRSVLLQLGARASDLHVHSFGCTRATGAPEPAPGIVASFYVLEPAPQPTARSGNIPAVAAEWQTVELKLGATPLEHAGQCELLEQVRQQILPLYTVRNLDFRDDCIPHQITLGGTRLRVEVLEPVKKGPAAPDRSP